MKNLAQHITESFQINENAITNIPRTDANGREFLTHFEKDVKYYDRFIEMVKKEGYVVKPYEEPVVIGGKIQNTQPITIRILNSRGNESRGHTYARFVIYQEKLYFSGASYSGYGNTGLNRIANDLKDPTSLSANHNTGIAGKISVSSKMINKIKDETGQPQSVKGSQVATLKDGIKVIDSVFKNTSAAQKSEISWYK